MKKQEKIKKLLRIERMNRIGKWRDNKFVPKC